MQREFLKICYNYFGALVSSTGLIMYIGHRKEIRNVSFRISLRWPIHIINPVDETKLSCSTSHRRSTLETYSSVTLELAFLWLSNRTERIKEQSFCLLTKPFSHKISLTSHL